MLLLHFFEIIEKYQSRGEYQAIFDYYLDNQYTLSEKIGEEKVLSNNSFNKEIVTASIGSHTVRETFQVRSSFVMGNRNYPASWRITLQGTFSYLQSNFNVTAVNNPTIVSVGNFTGTRSLTANGVIEWPTITNRTSSIPSANQPRFALTYRANASIPYDNSNGTVGWVNYRFGAQTHSFIRHSRMLQ